MSLKDQITEDMKTAMRAKDSERLGTIRLLQAAMKQKEVDERITLDDAAIVAIVDKLIKQRKDSITAFEGAGRQDLADKEKAEITVLQAYLPARMSEAGSSTRSRPSSPNWARNSDARQAQATWARSWAWSRPAWPARPRWARYPAP